MSVALILAGHGSHISPNTAGIVWQVVDRLRQWQVADEVTACFWKEEPYFHHVLDTVMAETIVIVPVFTAQGYFTGKVIPSEMGLDGDIMHRNGRTIYLTRTIGEHPFLETIVTQRVQDVLDTFQLASESVAVAVIGHGTKRDSQSRTSTQNQANQLRAKAIVAEVVDVYLDDTPDIPSLYQSTTSNSIIAVPFFLAPGSHVTQDVPNALGIQWDTTPTVVNGRTVYYTPPVGTDDSIASLILELARDTGLPFETKTSDIAWNTFPQAGCQELWDEVQASGQIQFGQLTLTPDSVRPSQSVSVVTVVDSPSELRKIIREEPFRPLLSTDDLPSGWQVNITSAEHLASVVETIYPTALAEWSAQRQGNFQTNMLENVSHRQQGMFKGLHALLHDEIEALCNRICSGCVRHVTWFHGSSPKNEIPCKEPCNWWLSHAKGE